MQEKRDRAGAPDPAGGRPEVSGSIELLKRRRPVDGPADAAARSPSAGDAAERSQGGEPVDPGFAYGAVLDPNADDARSFPGAARVSGDALPTTATGDGVLPGEGADAAQRSR